MKTAEEFLKQMNYSTNTQVCVEMNWVEEKIKDMGVYHIATKVMREFHSK